MVKFISRLTSDDSRKRELAVEICTDLVTEPEGEFIQEILTLLGSENSEVTLTILELLKNYENWLDSDWDLDLMRSGDSSVRIAAFRFFGEDPSWRAATLLLDALVDEDSEIRQIATEALHKIILCESTSFEVAAYLRHDNPQICEAASELLMGSGQDDLLEKIKI
jgi:HEAT repeat protein